MQQANDYSRKKETNLQVFWNICVVYRAQNGIKTLIHIKRLMFESVAKILAIHMKDIEQYFPMVLYKMVVLLEHVNEKNKNKYMAVF